MRDLNDFDHAATGYSSGDDGGTVIINTRNKDAGIVLPFCEAADTGGSPQCAY